MEALKSLLILCMTVTIIWAGTERNEALTSLNQCKAAARAVPADSGASNEQ